MVCEGPVGLLPAAFLALSPMFAFWCSSGIEMPAYALALLLGSLVLLSIAALRSMPTSILPEVTFPRVKVIADSGELPSDVVLRDVTRPLEESIRRVPGIIEIRSTTSRGSAEINLDSRWGSDLNLAVQRIQGQIEAVRPRLPPGTSVDVHETTNGFHSG